MLFEPGPLTLFTVAEIPQPQAWTHFTTASVEEVQALAGAGAELQIAALTFAAGGVNELEQGSAQELAGAAAEHERQVREHDGTIAAVSTNAGAQEGVLHGNASDVVRDINAGLPSMPEIPPDGYSRTGTTTPTPTQTWNAVVRQQFLAILRRPATAAEIAYAAQFEPDIATLQEWIASGAPMTGPPPPPPPSGPTEAEWAEWEAAVNVIFREYAGRDAFDGEQNYARRFYPDLQAVYDWMVAGTPA